MSNRVIARIAVRCDSALMAYLPRSIRHSRDGVTILYWLLADWQPVDLQAKIGYACTYAM